MRGHEEKIRVRAGADGRPLNFQWRGRWYRVREHVERWQARTSWWSPESSEAPLEETVWRVEAEGGGSRGVFDLRSGSTWVLVGVLD